MRTWVSWSSGKDSTYSLQRASGDDRLDVTGLLVTLNAAADRVAMHAVRRELVEAQAARVGLALHRVDLPWPCSNDIYERRIAAAMVAAATAGVERVVFGDLFLEDIRAYRESALQGTGIEPEFPLWDEPTDRLARRMIDDGIRAVLTCVDPAQLPGEFAGRQFDHQLLADLPAGVDPCGERGEFHTFVWDAPVFSAPIDVRVGEVIERDGFVYCDVLPLGSAA
ncbi:MAG: ATP-binding protein [Nitriliruptorales bacterium]|nr:ATP-binding protein [Nitriliruptorales bacterium]